VVIVLKKDITEEDKSSLKTFLEEKHFRVNEIRGEEDTILGAVGHLSIDPREVEIFSGVARVIPISKPYKMASREFRKENTVVEIPNPQGLSPVKIGGLRVSVIAGPCAVEDREQIQEIARQVASSGAVMLRGGAYKPRTSPYAFQGLKEEGLKLLKEAGEANALPVATEIVSAEHIPMMRDYVDVYQIGARNMQNFELLKKVGALGKPVILKRGISATIEEWLMAAEYLLSAGTNDVILCERGIRTYEKATRNTLDLSAIPILRELTHLPIIVDPSHAVGIRDKVPPMALAGVAAGADGIIVEVHNKPEKALSDGPQSLYPEQFDKLMRDIEVLAPVAGKEVARIRRPVKQEQVSLTGTDTAGAKPAGSAKAKPICAFSGSRGAYAEQAIFHYFDDEAEALAVGSFRDICKAVTDGRADYGILPIENSLAGSVYENYDNLARFEDISIVGSLKLRIEHQLLSVPGASLDTIKTVYSHPQGFAQCAAFMEEHPEWACVETVSTATAAKTVEDLKSPANAAIASGIAAKYYHLETVTAGIESDPQNYTRFLVIAAAQDCAAEAGTVVGSKASASVLFTTKNEPGALYSVLGIFNEYGLNLTKLESRPLPGQPWRYAFYADMAVPEGKADVVSEVMERLREKTEDARLLGVYSEFN
jgi:3-deoxy-7-phosphoheptulonate synthase